jgi:hypothetical protein
MDCGSVSGREKRLPLLQSPWIGSGANLAYFSVDEGTKKKRKKGPWHEADQPSISHAEAKDGLAIPPLPRMYSVASLQTNIL